MAIRNFAVPGPRYVRSIGRLRDRRKECSAKKRSKRFFFFLEGENIQKGRTPNFAIIVYTVLPGTRICVAAGDETPGHNGRRWSLGESVWRGRTCSPYDGNTYLKSTVAVSATRGLSSSRRPVLSSPAIDPTAISCTERTIWLDFVYDENTR